MTESVMGVTDCRLPSRSPPDTLREGSRSQREMRDGHFGMQVECKTY